MDTHAFADLLLRCAAIHYSLLLVAIALWGAAGERLYALYAHVFRIDRARFDAVVLALLGAYKIGIVLLFLVPGLVLRLTPAS